MFVSVTFDVPLVSDGLQRWTTTEELLQLVFGLLVVGGVHAGRGLHGCGGEMRQERDVHHSSQHTDRHDGRSVFWRNETDKQLFYSYS